MSTIATINSGDLISNSRTDINNNFAALNTDKLEASYLDTDTTLAANSDVKVATQKAVKAYVDAGGNVNASTTAKGIVEEATAAEVAAGTAVGATGARLFVNPSTASKTTFITTQVYASAGVSGSYVDLDLSAVVGVTQRVVLLRVAQAGGSSSNITFKRKGEATDYATAAAGGAGTAGLLFTSGGGIMYALVATDTSGVVQWRDTSANGIGISVNVEAYW